MVFEENKHPRDKDGKFTSKGNESSKSSNNRQEEIISQNMMQKANIMLY